MIANKSLLLVVLLAALIACYLVKELRIIGLQADLEVQTRRAARAEEKVKGLEAAAAYRETQLFALQGQATQCEEARAQEAAAAAIRRAITGPAREKLRTAQGGIASPRISEEGNTHDATRRAVAGRLNRPL